MPGDATRQPPPEGPAAAQRHDRIGGTQEGSTEHLVAPGAPYRTTPRGEPSLGPLDMPARRPGAEPPPPK